MLTYSEIVELANGGIKRIGTYNEIVGEDNVLKTPNHLSTQHWAQGLKRLPTANWKLPTIFNLSTRHSNLIPKKINIIESWPKKYMTFVGERRIVLSGGQRQRIGIARVLYKQADVIIFDEATIAQNAKTEKAVLVQFIETLDQDLIVLIFAHRLTTPDMRNRRFVITLGFSKQVFPEVL